MTNHLFQPIRQAAQDHASGKFIETPAGSSFTYSDMLALSGRYAAALLKLGAKPGKRIAVQIEKLLDVIVLDLGAIPAGAIFLPLNTAYTNAELAYFLADAEPKILVCDPPRKNTLSEVAAKAGVTTVETLRPDGSGSLPLDAGLQWRTSQMWAVRRMILPRSSIRQAQPGGRKARC